MQLSEIVKIVNGGPPIDINSVGLDGDYVKLSEGAHLSILVQLGVTGGATTLTVEEHTTNSGAGTAIDFDYRMEDTDSGDTLGDITAIGGTGGVACSTNDNVFYVVELDAISNASASKKKEHCFVK